MKLCGFCRLFTFRVITKSPNSSYDGSTARWRHNDHPQRYGKKHCIILLLATFERHPANSITGRQLQLIARIRKLRRIELYQNRRSPPRRQRNAEVRADDRIIIDAVREMRPPFSPTVVVDEFAELLKADGVTKVIGDHYGGNRRHRSDGQQRAVTNKSSKPSSFQMRRASLAGQKEREAR